MKVTRIIDVITIVLIIAIMGVYLGVTTDSTLLEKVTIPFTMSAWLILLVAAIAVAIIVTSILDK